MSSTECNCQTMDHLHYMGRGHGGHLGYKASNLAAFGKKWPDKGKISNLSFNRIHEHIVHTFLQNFGENRKMGGEQKAMSHTRILDQKSRFSVPLTSPDHWSASSTNFRESLCQVSYPNRPLSTLPSPYPVLLNTACNCKH